MDRQEFQFANGSERQALIDAANLLHRHCDGKLPEGYEIHLVMRGLRRSDGTLRVESYFDVESDATGQIDADHFHNDPSIAGIDSMLEGAIRHSRELFPECL